MPGCLGKTDSLEGSAQAKPGDGGVQLANDTSGKKKVSVLLRFTTASAASDGAALAEVVKIQQDQLSQSQTGFVDRCPISWIKEIKSHKN